MAIVAWHPLLPQYPLQDGSTVEENKNQTARFTPAVGHDLKRRRVTSAGGTMSYAFNLDETEVQLWRTYWENDLAAGGNDILYYDPVAMKNMRLDVIDDPRIVSVDGHSVWRLEFTAYRRPM